jgi:hypothetical protein
MSNLVYDLKIRDQASFEFREAYVWYEKQKAGFGEEFGTAINGTIAKILITLTTIKNHTKLSRNNS